MKSPDHQQQVANPPRDARGENVSTERASGGSASSEVDSSGAGSSCGSSSSGDSREADSKPASSEWVATSQVEGQSLGDQVMITIGTAVIGMNGGATGISVAGWLIHMRGWSYDMVGDLSIVLMALLALAGAQTFSRGSS